MASRFELDHDPIPVAHGGSNHSSNLTWRLKVEHREKTAKIDIPAIARVKRLTKKHEEHRAKLLAKKHPDTEGVRKPFSTIKSRGFDKTKTKKFNGKVVDRGTQ